MTASVDHVDASLISLFKQEVDSCAAVLVDGLLKLEKSPGSMELLEQLMRASHSIKGAARLVGMSPIAVMAHDMEECFVAAQNGKIAITSGGVDVMLKCADMLRTMAESADGSNADSSLVDQAEIERLLSGLKNTLNGREVFVPEKGPPSSVQESTINAGPSPARDKIVKVDSGRMNRIMALAGESLVESKRLHSHAEFLRRLKHVHHEWADLIGEIRMAESDASIMDGILRKAHQKIDEYQCLVVDGMAELEFHGRQVTDISARLHREVVASRMRPFSDGIRGFPRMVRDVSRSLGKEAQLVMDGQSTMVDRDVLEKMEAPLNHLLRNAIDHGLEFPDERLAANKPVTGTLRLSAHHKSGMLFITVADDGCGIDLDRLRRKVVEKNLVSADMAGNLEDEELMEFMFLPNFSTRDEVTEISGRGVGLDVVYDALRDLRGLVRVTTEFGKGAQFHLQLPLTLSVISAMIVDIGGEPYAFPLAKIEHILRVPPGDVREGDGRQYIIVNDANVELLSAHQILGMGGVSPVQEKLPVVVIGDGKRLYAVIVDAFAGEKELVVRPLPEKLGKIKDISAASILENGDPLLILDVDDMCVSMEKILSASAVGRIGMLESPVKPGVRKILVVDDSVTVREVEKRLLESYGYCVDVALDGMDAWNMLRENNYDLVVTDIDMPRMDGVELVRMMRRDVHYAGVPVMMVSYKDRDEDRLRGIEAGADCYLAKGSFHDENLRAVIAGLMEAQEQ